MCEPPGVRGMYTGRDALGVEQDLSFLGLDKHHQGECEKERELHLESGIEKNTYAMAVAGGDDTEHAERIERLLEQAAAEAEDTVDAAEADWTAQLETRACGFADMAAANQWMHERSAAHLRWLYSILSVPVVAAFYVCGILAFWAACDSTLALANGIALICAGAISTTLLHLDLQTAVAAHKLAALGYHRLLFMCQSELDVPSLQRGKASRVLKIISNEYLRVKGTAPAPIWLAQRDFIHARARWPSTSQHSVPLQLPEFLASLSHAVAYATTTRNTACEQTDDVHHASRQVDSIADKDTVVVDMSTKPPSYASSVTIPLLPKPITRKSYHACHNYIGTTESSAIANAHALVQREKSVAVAIAVDDKTFVSEKDRTALANAYADVFADAFSDSTATSGDLRVESTRLANPISHTITNTRIPSPRDEIQIQNQINKPKSTTPLSASVLIHENTSGTRSSGTRTSENGSGGSTFPRSRLGQTLTVLRAEVATEQKVHAQERAQLQRTNRILAHRLRALEMSTQQDSSQSTGSAAAVVAVEVNTTSPSTTSPFTSDSGSANTASAPRSAASAHTTQLQNPGTSLGSGSEQSSNVSNESIVPSVSSSSPGSGSSSGSGSGLDIPASVNLVASCNEVDQRLTRRVEAALAISLM